MECNLPHQIIIHTIEILTSYPCGVFQFHTVVCTWWVLEYVSTEVLTRVLGNTYKWSSSGAHQTTSRTCISSTCAYIVDLETAFNFFYRLTMSASVGEVVTAEWWPHIAFASTNHISDRLVVLLGVRFTKDCAELWIPAKYRSATGLERFSQSFAQYVVSSTKTHQTADVGFIKAREPHNTWNELAAISWLTLSPLLANRGTPMKSMKVNHFRLCIVRLQ